MSVHSYNLPISKKSILESYIESYKILKYTDTNRIQFIPSGRFEIFFQLEERFLCKFDDKLGFIKRPMGFIGGLHTKAYYAKSTQKESKALLITFKPEMAKFVIPDYLNHFKNQTVSLEDFWGNDGRFLIERINNESNCENQFKIIEQFLLKRIQISDLKLKHIFREIIHENYSIDVKELAKISGVSYSYFRKIFKNEIGVSPKEYIRVIRINKAINQIKQNHKKPLTNLAYELGYYDQSHFIKDFKSFTDRTPKEYLNT